MLKKLLLCTLAVTTIAEQTAQARCIYRPQVRAGVAIEGCVAVTFGSSHSHAQFEFVPNRPTTLYKEGASYSGVFLIVDVKSSTLVSPEDASSDELGEWASGARKGVFVSGSVEQVCPATLGEIVTVTTDPGFCCDMLPWEGRCLVPSTVEIVTVAKGIAH
jgi:hypothetical protein